MSTGMSETLAQLSGKEIWQQVVFIGSLSYSVAVAAWLLYSKRREIHVLVSGVLAILAMVIYGLDIISKATSNDDGTVKQDGFMSFFHNYVANQTYINLGISIGIAVISTLGFVEQLTGKRYLGSKSSSKGQKSIKRSRQRSRSKSRGGGSRLSLFR